jgi:hypothetical protein
MITLRQMLTISQNEDHLCTVLVLRERDVQRAYRISELNKAQLARPTESHREAGRIGNICKRQLTMVWFRQIIKQLRSSIIPVPVDGAGGSVLL